MGQEQLIRSETVLSQLDTCVTAINTVRITQGFPQRTPPLREGQVRSLGAYEKHIAQERLDSLNNVLKNVGSFPQFLTQESSSGVVITIERLLLGMAICDVLTHKNSQNISCLQEMVGLAKNPSMVDSINQTAPQRFALATEYSYEENMVNNALSEIFQTHAVENLSQQKNSINKNVKDRYNALEYVYGLTYMAGIVAEPNLDQRLQGGFGQAVVSYSANVNTIYNRLQSVLDKDPKLKNTRFEHSQEFLEILEHRYNLSLEEGAVSPTKEIKSALQRVAFAIALPDFTLATSLMSIRLDDLLKINENYLLTKGSFGTEDIEFSKKKGKDPESPKIATRFKKISGESELLKILYGEIESSRSETMPRNGCPAGNHWMTMDTEASHTFRPQKYHVDSGEYAFSENTAGKLLQLITITAYAQYFDYKQNSK